MVELWRAYQALGIKHEFYLAVYDQGMYCFETNALLFALLLQLSSLFIIFGLCGSSPDIQGLIFYLDSEGHMGCWILNSDYLCARLSPYQL